MSYRHWFVVLTKDGREYRSGPYATRRMADRKARQYHKHAPTATVEVVYDTGPSAHRGRY